MNTAKKIEQLIKKFFKIKKSSIAMPIEKDEQILNDALAAFGKTKINNNFISLNILFKMAAAAIIILVAGAFINHLKHNNTTLLSRAIEQIENADTLIYNVQISQLLPGSRIQTKWSLNKLGYARIDSNDGYFSIILDTVRMKGVGILPREKRSIEIEMPNIQNQTAHVPFLIIQKLKSFISLKIEMLGKKQFSGNTVEGFCLTDKDSVTKIWIDSNSKLPVLMEMAFIHKPDMNIVMTNFQINTMIEKPSLENYEKMPIRLNAESWMANEFYLNEFFASLIKLKNKGNIFPTESNPQNLSGIALRFLNENNFARMSNYNIEIVCP